MPINTREKLMSKSLWGNKDFVKRPSQECKNEDSNNISFKCIGMPSGHVEGITVSMYFLYRNGILPIEWFVVIVTLVAAERIIMKRHTFLQVLAGLIIGIFYGEIYVFIINLIVKFIIDKYLITNTHSDTLGSVP